MAINAKMSAMYSAVDFIIMGKVGMVVKMRGGVVWGGGGGGGDCVFLVRFLDFC